VIVTATDLANDSKGIVDRVARRGETTMVQRRGKSIVEIRRAVGISGKELVERLKQVHFTEADRNELKGAMATANKVWGYAGRD
jgi:hypothetical protein